jgi:hypothetical protein
VRLGRSIAVPLPPALVFAIATARGRDKSLHGESPRPSPSPARHPVSLAAGAFAQTAAGLAIPFALLFRANTLAVRVVILKARRAVAILVPQTRPGSPPFPCAAVPP